MLRNSNVCNKETWWRDALTSDSCHPIQHSGMCCGQFNSTTICGMFSFQLDHRERRYIHAEILGRTTCDHARFAHHHVAGHDLGDNYIIVHELSRLAYAHGQLFDATVRCCVTVGRNVRTVPGDRMRTESTRLLSFPLRSSEID